jgi:hypothetical protein
VIAIQNSTDEGRLSIGPLRIRGLGHRGDDQLVDNRFLRHTHHEQDAVRHVLGWLSLISHRCCSHNVLIANALGKNGPEAVLGLHRRVVHPSHASWEAASCIFEFGRSSGKRSWRSAPCAKRSWRDRARLLVNVGETASDGGLGPPATRERKRASSSVRYIKFRRKLTTESAVPRSLPQTAASRSEWRHRIRSGSPPESSARSLMRSFTWDWPLTVWLKPLVT